MFRIVIIIVTCLFFTSVSLAETTRLTIKETAKSKKTEREVENQGKEIFEEAKIQAVIANSAQSKRTLPIAIILLSKLKEIKDNNEASEKAKRKKLKKEEAQRK